MSESNLGGRKTRAKVLYNISDIHDGGIYAICSEDPYNSDLKLHIKPNLLQNELRGIWYDGIDSLSRKPDLVVNNGEPVDGANPKQLGNQSWTTNLADQAKDVIKLLRVIKGEKYMFIRGSGYHVQIQGTSAEQWIAEQMGGVDYSIYEGVDGNKADYWANVEIYGKTFSFTHHTPYAKFFAYRATPLAKEMALMALDKGRNMKYDVISRGHVHNFMYIRSAHTHAYTTGAWKYPDGHLTRGGLGGIFPDIGGVEVIVETNGEIIIKPHITELKIKPSVFKV